MHIMGKKGKYLIGALLVAGVFMSAYGVFAIFEARNCSGWPVVKGRICDSFISELTDVSTIRPTGTCMPDIKYEYEYKGQTYFNNTISYFTSRTLGLRDFYYAAPEAEVCAFVEKYPVNAIVDVHVNPTNPDFAVLDTGLKLPVFLPLILGVLLICAACHLIVFGKHYFFDTQTTAQ